MNHNFKQSIKVTIFSSASVAVEGNYDLEAPTTSPSLNLHHAVQRILNLKTGLGHLFFTFHLHYAAENGSSRPNLYARTSLHHRP